MDKKESIMPTEYLLTPLARKRLRWIILTWLQFIAYLWWASAVYYTGDTEWARVPLFFTGVASFLGGFITTIVNVTNWGDK